MSENLLKRIFQVESLEVTALLVTYADKIDVPTRPALLENVFLDATAEMINFETDSFGGYKDCANSPIPRRRAAVNHSF